MADEDEILRFAQDDTVLFPAERARREQQD